MWHGHLAHVSRTGILPVLSENGPKTQAIPLPARFSIIRPCSVLLSGHVLVNNPSNPFYCNELEHAVRRQPHQILSLLLCVPPRSRRPLRCVLPNPVNPVIPSKKTLLCLFRVFASLWQKSEFNLACGLPRPVPVLGLGNTPERRSCHRWVPQNGPSVPRLTYAAVMVSCFL